jgi:hypothetical protein
MKNKKWRQISPFKAFDSMVRVFPRLNTLRAALGALNSVLVLHSFSRLGPIN